MTWLIHMSAPWICAGTLLIHVWETTLTIRMCDMTYSCVGETWLIHVCGTTRLIHVSGSIHVCGSIHVSKSIHVCGSIRVCGSIHVCGSIQVCGSIHVCVMTLSCVWHDSLICVWHDSFMCGWHNSSSCLLRPSLQAQRVPCKTRLEKVIAMQNEIRIGTMKLLF